MASQVTVVLFVYLSMLTYSVYGYSKYGRTCADIGCPSTEVCVMAEDPCTYGRRDECGAYPTCQRRSNIVKTCENFVCPPTMYCRLDGDTPKCIPDNSPLGGRNSNPNANVDPHTFNGGSGSGSGERNGGSGLYPQVPSRGQTTTRAPVYRPNGGGTGGYQGGSIGSGYPGNGGGGYGGGSIGGGYPGGYSGYPGSNNQQYPGYPGYPSSGGSGYPNSGYSGGYSNVNNPYNSNPYYTPNNNQQRYGYGNNAATTPNPLYEGLKTLGILCYLLHALIAHARQL